MSTDQENPFIELLVKENLCVRNNVVKLLEVVNKNDTKIVQIHISHEVNTS